MIVMMGTVFLTETSVLHTVSHGMTRQVPLLIVTAVTASKLGRGRAGLDAQEDN
jgi:hypothetical protein